MAIITGAGRGLGREHALLFAAEGRQGRGQRPRRRPRRQRRRPHRGGAGRRRDHGAGGEAVANDDNVADWEGGKRLIAAAIEAFGGLDILVNNAGHPARPDAREHDARRSGTPSSHVHMKGHFVPTRWAATYWREQVKAGDEVKAQHHPHVVDVGAARQPGTDELRRGEGGHRLVLDHLRQGAGALRRAVQLHRAGGPHPADRGDAWARRDGRRRPRTTTRSTCGTRPTCRRSWPTWPRPTARSTARRSSCRAAPCELMEPWRMGERRRAGRPLDDRGLPKLLELVGRWFMESPFAA